MVEMPGLYIVIANDAHARFVRPGPDNRPHTIHTVDAGTLGERDGDAPDAARAGHAGFAHSLAKRINNDFSVDLFSHLVVVAPVHVLRELLAMLDDVTRASLIGSGAADLVTVPDHDLTTHLRAWLPPIGEP
jgi:protein required for attachment to host cells